jgi:hypothetical protein
VVGQFESLFSPGYVACLTARACRHRDSVTPVPDEERRGPWSAAWAAVAVVSGAYAAGSAGSSVPELAFTAGLGLLSVVALYMCFASLTGWWPAGVLMQRVWPRAVPGPAGRAAVALAEPEEHKDRLLLGDRLMRGEVLHSAATIHHAEGRFTLTMQSDGNLVVDPADGTLPWFASDTVMPRSGNYLKLWPDGNLILCTGTGEVIRESHTAGEGAGELVMQHDGNLVLQGDEGPVWTTRGFGFRWRRCPAGTPGCICGTVLGSEPNTDGTAAGSQD